jgi:hypothetical protein
MIFEAEAECEVGGVWALASTASILQTDRIMYRFRPSVQGKAEHPESLGKLELGSLDGLGNLGGCHVSRPFIKFGNCGITTVLMR